MLYEVITRQHRTDQVYRGAGRRFLERNGVRRQNPFQQQYGGGDGQGYQTGRKEFSPGQSGGRITSYNVCYTKLLRHADVETEIKVIVNPE